MAETDSDKSQEATPHRRQQAREEGHVPRSQDLASAALLLAGWTALMMLGGGLVECLARLFTQHLGGTAWLSTDPEFIVAHWSQTTFELAKYLLPFLGVLLVAGVMANILQVGLLFLPEKLMPDINRLNPLQGLKRLFSMENFVRLAMGMVKITILAAVAWWSLSGHRDKIFALTELAVPQIAVYLVELLLGTGLKLAFALFVLAIIDYGFQRWKYEQDIRMTTQEVREEMKNLDGNPQIAARRRQVQRQLAMNRLRDAVPKADVVVTNPTELSVAIQYDPETMAAPIVVAKGAGTIAQRIRQLALQHGIPIVEKKPLARALYRDVRINHPVPHDKYAAVAEVLAYVYQLKGKKIPTPRGAA